MCVINTHEAAMRETDHCAAFITRMLYRVGGLRRGSQLVGRRSQIFSARELEAPFAAIAADNWLDGDVLVGPDLVPDDDGDRLTEVFQGFLLPGRIVPEIERFLDRRRHDHDQRLVAPACTQPPV